MINGPATAMAIDSTAAAAIARGAIRPASASATRIANATTRAASTARATATIQPAPSRSSPIHRAAVADQAGAPTPPGSGGRIGEAGVDPNRSIAPYPATRTARAARPRPEVEGAAISLNVWSALARPAERHAPVQQDQS